MSTTKLKEFSESKKNNSFSGLENPLVFNTCSLNKNTNEQGL